MQGSVVMEKNFTLEKWEAEQGFVLSCQAKPTSKEVVMSFDDVTAADEVFLSGNFSKVMPVTAFEDRQYQVGPVTKRVRQLYWDWARSAA
jgi:branched-subunit amino acid aminotransferase/4-amino-4-deoxychorismate lyase